MSYNQYQGNPYNQGPSAESGYGQVRTASLLPTFECTGRVSLARSVAWLGGGGGGGGEGPGMRVPTP